MNLQEAMDWTEESDIFMARSYPEKTQQALIATHEALLEVLARERELLEALASFEADNYNRQIGGE